MTIEYEKGKTVKIYFDSKQKDKASDYEIAGDLITIIKSRLDPKRFYIEIEKELK